MLHPSLPTALAIADATKEGFEHDHVIEEAREMLTSILGHDSMPSDEIIRAVFRYSATLAASVASSITNVIYTESEMDAMLSEMKEMGAFDNLE